MDYRNSDKALLKKIKKEGKKEPIYESLAKSTVRPSVNLCPVGLSVRPSSVFTPTYQSRDCPACLPAGRPTDGDCPSVRPSVHLKACPPTDPRLGLCLSVRPSACRPTDGDCPFVRPSVHLFFCCVCLSVKSGRPPTYEKHSDSYLWSSTDRPADCVSVCLPLPCLPSYPGELKRKKRYLTC